MKAKEMAALPAVDIIGAIGTGEKIVEASLPILKQLFDGIASLFQGAHFDSLAFPHGKRLAIEELQKQLSILQAQNVVQKSQNSIMIAALKQLGVDVDKIVV